MDCSREFKIRGEMSIVEWRLEKKDYVKELITWLSLKWYSQNWLTCLDTSLHILKQTLLLSKTILFHHTSIELSYGLRDLFQSVVDNSWPSLTSEPTGTLLTSSQTGLESQVKCQCPKELEVVLPNIWRARNWHIVRFFQTRIHLI